MTVLLTGNDLTINDVVQVAHHHAPVAVSPVALERMCKARAVVERLAEFDTPIYGVTTGLGALKNVQISTNDTHQFQRNILMSHAAGIGPDYSEPIVRAMMLTRLNGMARGGAGVQPAVFMLLLDMLNAGIHPIVPSRGSLGMADLAPLAHMALPLIGLSEVSYQGRRRPSTEAFELAGLSLIELGAKDALALCSANSASVGHGALVVADSLRLMDCADIVVALSLEGFQGNVGPLDPRAHAGRPFPGQQASAARMRAILKGSHLWRVDLPRSIQDPLSFRCATQVHGACRNALAFLCKTLEIELNAISDNPIVLSDDGVIVSNGNFHVGGLAMGFDLLCIALAQVMSLATNRTIRLMDPKLSFLPTFLAPQPGINCGFAILQKTITSLNAEIRFNAAPASLDFTPVAGDIEDHATMATLCVNKTSQIIDAGHRVLAIELLSAAQAVDLCDQPVLGVGTRRAYELVRSIAPFSPVDRVLAPDVEAVYELLVSGRLMDAIAAEVQDSTCAPSATLDYQI